MRSSAAWGSDVELGCVEERRRWTLRGEKRTCGASGINLRQTLTRLLPWGAPSASTGRAPSALHGRRAACKTRCFIVCVSACATSRWERETCKGTEIAAASISPFGTWDRVVLCVCFCIREEEECENRGWRAELRPSCILSESGLKAKSAHQTVCPVVLFWILFRYSNLRKERKREQYSWWH